MRRLPTGTLTLLFSDIEGSTLMVHRLGNRWGEALSTQRSILRSVFEAHEGHEMGTEGDSFFVVFDSAGQALLAALEGQRRLQTHPWPDDAPLRVRMGLHTGEPKRHEDGYIGLDVHRAARIAATAHGGQTVLSNATRMLLADPGEEVEVRDLGWHRLKDLDEPEHLYDAVVPGLVSDFPALRSLGTPANLPGAATGLVGRQRELAELSAALDQPGTRLLTLTGPGGTGKTRLAVAVAGGVEARFPAGVYFVPAHTADRAALLWVAIADALGAGGEAEQLPRDRVRRLLGHRRALLVLDNLEQIPDADAVVSQLLTDAPQVSVLATSRRPLHLVGEREHPVPPLPLPDRGSADRAAAERAGAVELFVRQAQMVRPGFRLTDDNVGDVAELCRRLDGLPLAIELAAARSRLLGPRALLSRIDARLGTGVTATDRPQRQRTLGDTIAWSYDLLDEAQQAVFRRLGVFAAGSDLAAVESVASSGAVDPLDVVAQLVDASLVQVSEGPDGEPRISMLETIRSFARERLDASGECDEVRLRHARWCVSVAASMDELLHGPSQMAALDRLDVAADDIRAALDWSLRPVADVGEEITECGYTLLMRMSTYWYRFGYVAEGRGWHERAVAVADRGDSCGILHALHGMGILMLQQNDFGPATEALERSLAMARRLGDRDLEARELNSLAIARRSAGDLVGSRALLEASAALAREINNAHRVSTALSNLAMTLCDVGDYAGAVRSGREAIAASTALGDPWAVAIDETNLALALLRAEGPERAYDALSGVAARAIALADADLSISIVELFAMVLAELGSAELAARLMGTADAQRTRSGLPRPAPDQVILDRSLDVAKAALPAEDWARAYGAGAAVSIDQAVAEGLALRVPHGFTG
ncbi:MAG TPA: adenylate/guanylate cyclase domain-containing protein [Nocardioidaceae bacterium]|nr:adenylate/guanylate cyclase domain-containing protein [Nocardioidaceae bacterium]